jgi:hypothetical protein
MPISFRPTLLSALNAGHFFELPGAPFILASLMLLCAAVIAWRTTKAGEL